MLSYAAVMVDAGCEEEAHMEKQMRVIWRGKVMGL